MVTSGWLGADEGNDSRVSDLDITEPAPPPAGAPTGGGEDRPAIAVSGLKRSDDHDDVGRIPIHYVHALDAAGGASRVLSAFPLHADEVVPDGLDVRTDLEPDDVSAIDDVAGLVLTGGGDVDPSLYGEEPHPRTYNVSPRRDRFEMNLLDAALERSLPVFAICRGMQLANVHFGGTLEQHLLDVMERLPHDRDRARAEPVHDVRLAEPTLLAECLGTTRVGVNSHHHQALKEVAPPFEEIGWAPDGVLEAVVSTEHEWFVAVQWHPEVMTPVERDQARLFECFVAAARDRARALSRTRA